MLICNRIRVSSHGQGGKTAVIEIPRCWAVRCLSCGCDGGKGYAWYSSVGGCGRVCRRIVCRWIWRLLQSKGHQSSAGTRKKNCFGCRALPCLGQPSSGCEAGRPLELRLEGSLTPRHRVLADNRRSDWAPEVSGTDLTALSHHHILTILILPASQPTTA